MAYSGRRFCGLGSSPARPVFERRAKAGMGGGRMVPPRKPDQGVVDLLAILGSLYMMHFVEKLNFKLKKLRRPSQARQGTPTNQQAHL